MSKNLDKLSAARRDIQSLGQGVVYFWVQSGRMLLHDDLVFTGLSIDESTQLMKSLVKSGLVKAQACFARVSGL